ncbi:hypothetical protein UY3_17197, partial [Chelonia mydas]
FLQMKRLEAEMEAKRLEAETELKHLELERTKLGQPSSLNSPPPDKDWSGVRTFAVYDDYPIPMLLGEDLTSHVRLTKRVRMVTRSQAKQASTPNSIPKPPKRTQSVSPDTIGPGTQPELVEPDPRPESIAEVVDPVCGTQPEPVQGSDLAEQSAPESVLATPPESGEPAPEGATEPAPAAAAKLVQEAQLEPQIPPSAPAESGSQSTENPHHLHRFQWD